MLLRELVQELYYCSAGQYFLFASELRTLLGRGLIPRRLDPAGLINYLNFGSVYDPLTMIAGVSALEAGHYAAWENGRVTDAMTGTSHLTDGPARHRAISQAMRLRGKIAVCAGAVV